MILHVINGKTALDLSRRGANDSILFIEDGVYCQVEGPSYVLQADLEARGLTATSNQSVVDYDGFVGLCCQHAKVISW